MKLSIIVPAYNADETLEECLSAIFTAIGERHDCEVIVVDDGSEDRTAEIARRFPVRMIQSESNEGRIRAREKGARAAKAEQLIFVDSRVITPPDVLAVLEKLDYEPIIGGSAALHERDNTAHGRLLYLIRKRIYSPYFPQSSAFPIIRLRRDNFNDVPKGTTFLYISKSRFLAALPEDRSRFVNDDTRILGEVVKTRDILISRDIRIVHLHRKSLWQELQHLYERGPRFADFHLQPSGKYYPIWIMASLLTFLAAASAYVYPLSLILFTGFILTVLLTIGIRLAEKPRDVITVVMNLPLIALSFGLGILKGKLIQIRKVLAKHWNRRIAVFLMLAAAILFWLINRDAFQTFTITKWRYVPLLALIQVSFLLVNGLILKTFLTVFDIHLKPKMWFGLAALTALGSYIATSVGGMTLRATILKQKYALPYSKFLTVASTTYLINFLVIGALGLITCAALYFHNQFSSWSLPAFFLVIGTGASVLVGLRPLQPSGSGRLARLVSNIYAGWDFLLQHPRTIWQVAFLLSINIFLLALSLIAGFALFAFELQPLHALLIVLVSVFSFFFSITPGNLGVQEAMTASIAHLIGYEFQQVIAVTAITRVVSMAIVFSLGSVFSYLLIMKENPPQAQ